MRKKIVTGLGVLAVALAVSAVPTPTEAPVCDQTYFYDAQTQVLTPARCQ